MYEKMEEWENCLVTSEATVRLIKKYFVSPDALATYHHPSPPLSLFLPSLALLSFLSLFLVPHSLSYHQREYSRQGKCLHKLKRLKEAQKMLTEASLLTTKDDEILHLLTTVSPSLSLLSPFPIVHSSFLPYFLSLSPFLSPSQSPHHRSNTNSKPT